MTANDFKKKKRKIKEVPRYLAIDEQLKIFAGILVAYLMKNQNFLIKEIGIDKKKSLPDQ